MTEIKKQEKNKVYFDLTISAEEIKKAEMDVYKKNKSYFNVPGFRKGKAPKKIIENVYGDGIFFEDAINEVLPKMYEEAIKELDLDVIDQPNVDIEEFNRGEDVVVNIDVEVKPEVKLGNYKGVEIEEVPTEVSDELIDNELEKERHLNARKINVDDRAAKEGDKVNIDFAGKVDGEAFEGGTAEDQELELGAGNFIPGFEDGIVGKNVGETFDIDVKFPEDYFSEELQGKDAVFTITLNSISVEELPEVDDEFIKDISEFDTVDEYKEDVRKKKTEEVENSAKNIRVSRVLDKVVEGLEVELPPVMVENAMDEQIRNMDYNMRSQGIALEQYLQMLGQSLDEFKETMRDDVEQEVLRSLAVEAVIKEEGFEVSDEEMEKEAKDAAAKYFADDEEKQEEMVKTMLEGNTEMLRDDLIRRKAIDFLVDNAKEVEAKEESTEE
ncbi:trigger factor [Peptoniphilus sp. KCTC 25270]|uniref:trigger factor n=1 Tax=Peptoniphilus sp. KCTC 25270 TaxID=2897414 RepID=UPI001E4C1612|nr:trigger factor [Peptoniphilus sp. KCTC 25270]MCD1146519.1 trigger factor [Peptoniphilus sp. KCTC 25270]